MKVIQRGAADSGSAPALETDVDDEVYVELILDSLQGYLDPVCAAFLD